MLRGGGGRARYPVVFPQQRVHPPTPLKCTQLSVLIEGLQKGRERSGKWYRSQEEMLRSPKKVIFKLSDMNRFSLQSMQEPYIRV
ncbi:hypothetical protein EYF80_014347 [Liparis tanakae]|uniref:Uncharacterized protein n=1 Tax=Liparis tanakae TaxID=230148 RepID=A0A4Z2IDB7_9TELE|nr:hypothetical protein EYF80_014347 [Liparis tanakae]